MPDLQQLNARDALQAMAENTISCEQLAEDCLARIAIFEPTVGVWAYLNPEHVLAEARQADSRRRQGLNSTLNGIPVGIKDIFDTCDMPTENGTPANQSRQPDTDAIVVRLLREAGAVIAGKTVTAELAVYSPGKTAQWPEAAVTTQEALLTAIRAIDSKAEELIFPEIATRAIEITGELDSAMAGFDCVLTPATPAAAPAGLASTGNPIFSTLWSLCGSPALSLPVLADPSGLPLGLQLVGPSRGDMRLSQAAQWLEEKFLSRRKQPTRSY